MLSLLLNILILFPLTGFACNCPQTEELKTKQAIELISSEHVFIGEILEINQNDHSFKVKVIESFKGFNKNQIITGSFDPTCGPNIDQKGKWLIYGNSYGSDTLFPNQCGLTRSFSQPELGHYKIKIPEGINDSEYWNYHKKMARDHLDKEIFNLRNIKK